MVRFLLLLFVALHLDTATALSLRGISKSKLTRDGLHRLMGKQRRHLDRWVKSAMCGGALLTLACLPTIKEAGKLTSPIVLAAEASNEQASPIQLVKTEADVSVEQAHTASWSIAVTAKGEIGHMHVQTIEEEDAIRIAGYIEPTSKGRKYLDPEPVRTYLADKSYAIHNRSYNGYTMPLRLSWLASERRRTLKQINAVLHTIAASEQALVELGNSMYRDFSRLHVATTDDYKFDNLAEQIEVEFAGRSFSDYHEVKEVIERRYSMLQNKKISHKQRQQGVQLDQEVLNVADAAYRVVLSLQPSSEVEPLQLNYETSAAEDADFKLLVENLARLKLARLLLANDILALYKPFTMRFSYSAGVKERLTLTVYMDDSERKDVALRYESRTTSIKHRKEFTLGRVDFDHHLNIKKMWLSLKPRGGLAGFAKVTFKPCVAGECPEPDFEQ